MALLKSLPEFPHFIPLAREHREVLEASMSAARPEISELTFAYQWVWRPHTRCCVSRWGDALLLKNNSASGAGSYLLPPVALGPEEATRVIVSVLSAGSHAECFARVPALMADRLACRADLAVDEQPERADYVYLASELRELSGARFDGKRNHIRRFWASCKEAEYREMDASLASACAHFCKQWLSNHPARRLPGLQREVDTTLAMLAEREWLGPTGGTLAIGDRILAFALGEPLNHDTFVVRVEKADTSVPGAYQAINQEFARHAAGGFGWINREQDLGLPGLRRAKQSYYPHHLVRKYRVSIRR